jgi:hypothetical protein
MTPLTFKQYLRTLDEDADSDIAKLNIQKQNLVIRKAQATKPLDDQITNADKLLMQKEKQKQADDKKKGAAATTAQLTANKTTTPGSAGAQTPGRTTQVSNTPRV